MTDREQELHRRLHAQQEEILALRAELAQHVAECQRIHALIETLPVGVVDADANATIRLSNPAAHEMLGGAVTGTAWGPQGGYSLHYLNGIRCDPDTLPLPRALAHGETSRGVELLVRIEGGEEKILSVDARPQRDADGAITGAVATLTDITERRRVEDQLRLLASAVNQARDAMTITDAQLDLPGPKIVMVNPAFTAMTGYTREEVIGRDPRFLQGPLSDRAVLDRLRTELENDEPFFGQTYNYRKDGTPFIIEWRVTPVRDERGVTTHFLAIQRDITDRVRAEEERARLLAEVDEQRRLFQTVIEEAPAGIAILDGVTLHAKWVNVAYREFLEGPYRHMDLTGVPVRDFITNFDSGALPEIFAQVADTGEPYTNPEYMHVGYARGTTYWRWSLLPLPRPDAARPDLMIVAFEMTEFVRVRNQIQAERTRLDTVLATLPVGVFIADASGRITVINREAERIWGEASPLPTSVYDFGNYEGWRCDTDECIAPTEWPAVRALLTGEASLNEEIRLHCPDESIGFILDSAVPLRDADGTITGVVVVSQDITRRKRIEEELRASDERFQLVNRATNDIIWDWNLLNNHIAWNAMVESTPGISREALGNMPQTWAEHIHPEDRERVVRGIYRAIASTDGVWSDEYRFGGLDGIYRTYLNRALIARDEQGYGYRMIGSMLDLTERDEAETKLRILAAVVENSNDFIGISNPDLTPIFLNEAGRHMVGLDSVEEVERLTVMEYFWPEDRLLIEREAVPAMLRDGHWSGEVRFRHFKTGETIPTLWNAFVIKDADGTPIAWATISPDLGPLKRAEEERERLLREVRRRVAELDSTLASVADALIIYSPHGEILLDNPAARYLLNGTLEAEEYGALPQWVDTLAYAPDGHRLAVEETPAARAARGETVLGEVLVFHRRDGGESWVSVTAAPIVLPDDTLIGVVGTYTDITQLHDLQEQREVYMHTISHDLRTPLTVINGHAQLLNDFIRREHLNGQLSASVDAIYRSARRMNVMIQDMVDAARMEGGNLVLHQRPIDVATYLEKMLSRVAMAFAVERIQLDIPASLPPVFADPDRLERILVNLLSNALKYSDPDTPVVMRVRQTETEVIFTVIDQGIGIDPQDLPHIFERYFRPKGPHKVESVGLGLYITAMLVRAHGGHVAVVSTPGIGSEFSFTLPIATGDTPEA